MLARRMDVMRPPAEEGVKTDVKTEDELKNEPEEVKNGEEDDGVLRFE
jgi:hypothetical protein